MPAGKLNATLELGKGTLALVAPEEAKRATNSAKKEGKNNF